MAAVPVEKWGRDHWSTFQYIVTVANGGMGDGRGEINRNKMRVSHKRHPLLAGHLNGDGSRYPTRLKNGEELTEHDDWDCLEDIQDHALVSIFTLVSGFVSITPLGHLVSNDLQRHKREGGTYETYVPKRELLAQMTAALIGNRQR